MEQLAVQDHAPWWRTLGQRMQWAWLAFTAPSMTPVVTLEQGIQLDLRSRTIVIPGDFHLHSRGTMRLTSDEHVIVHSGVERGGFIFFNTPEDDRGNPIIQQPPLLEHSHEH
jgi:hypothetical protein